MSILRFGSITITVKGYTLNNGIPYFQKAVPLRLRSRLGKATIKIRLAAENGHFAVQCQRLTLKYEALFKALLQDANLVPAEAKKAALALLDIYRLKPGDGLDELQMPEGWDGSFDPTPWLSSFEDDLTGSHVEKVAKAALNNKLPVLLSEAFAVYLNNHRKGGDKEFVKNQKQHWDKLVTHCGDVALEALTREKAKEFRDARLFTGVKTTTLLREINVIRAVINVARDEIPLNIKNQFERITIRGANEDKTDRVPFERPEVQALLNAATTKDDEKRRIVIVLALTGARLAEIVGLRKQDFDSVNACIDIRSHKTRSLKTKSSPRIIPLLPQALNALNRQMHAGQTEYMFPAYANEITTKADSASAALNKWAKTIVPVKTMHSFRHTLRDQLRAVMCPESVSKELGGWSTVHDVSVGYGQGYPLDLKREWLSKAYAWLADGEVTLRQLPAL